MVIGGVLDSAGCLNSFGILVKNRLLARAAQNSVSMFVSVYRAGPEGTPRGSGRSETCFPKPCKHLIRRRRGGWKPWFSGSQRLHSSSNRRVLASADASPSTRRS
jgi:hypothetical protein